MSGLIRDATDKAKYIAGEMTDEEFDAAAYRTVEKLCINPECTEYAGKDYENPRKVISIDKIYPNRF